ncbi:DUF1853 family protein [Nitrincola tapanii]|uniref:DUF1853 family protein n=1 Tax=Nitrincola tapanii TaxID=1708751 RepID=A0A5A9W1T8_9GAMM|nr:DUF1853 family protein [Nitrincola tapanii]KAA0874179.1 DUF1853 family protein [Nitrincola tapanii]
MTWHALLAQLKHPVVRDLAWAINSEEPSIFRCGALLPQLSAWSDRSPAWQDTLLQLDQAPHALLEHLAQKPNRRLGLYFEQLWHFYLQQSPRFQLLGHNLQIYDSKGITLGELDLILLDQDLQLQWHQELAVKFYLHLGGEESILANWVGPDLRDRLDIKYAHICQHQLPLRAHPQTQAYLRCQHLQPAFSRAVFKGRYFRPGLQDQGWIPQAQLSSLPQSGIYQLLERSEWFAPRAQAERPHDYAALQAACAHPLQAPQQLACFPDANRPEQQRLFIVPDDWRETALNLSTQTVR